MRLSTNPNDVVKLSFGIRAEDNDGDRANGTITVDVKDDGPCISNKEQERNFDDNGLVNGPISYTHTLTHDYGQDGAGSIDATGNFLALLQVGGQYVSECN